MMGEVRILIKIIRLRQKNWIGQILRGEGLLKEVIEGRYVERRLRGRKKSMLDDLKASRSYQERKRLAQDCGLEGD